MSGYHPPDGHNAGKGADYSLDAAWAEVEAALPEGWRLTSLNVDGMTWDAIVDGGYATPLPQPADASRASPRARPMIVMFTGSRDFNHEAAVRRALTDVQREDATVHVGDARGLDYIVRTVCGEMDIPCVVFRADWRREGRAAGLRRNKRMIDGGPARVMAFYGPSGETRGTKHAVDLALAKGIDVMVYRQANDEWAWAVP